MTSLSSLKYERLAGSAVGSLLICTAIMKVDGHASLMQADILGGVMPSLYKVSIFWELLLGCSLILGAAKIFNWFATFFTFSLFTVASAYMVRVGFADCGCFGTIEMNPRYALLIDIVVLALLVINRPVFVVCRWSPQAVDQKSPRRCLTSAVIVIFLVLAISGCCYFALDMYGGLQRQALIAPQSVDLGEGSPGAILPGTVEVVNQSGAVVRIIGGTSDCSCVASDDLPITIQAGGRASIKIKIKLPSSTYGIYIREIVFRTDSRHTPYLRIKLRSRVSNAA